MLIFLKSNIYVYDVHFKHKHAVKENVVYIMTYVRHVVIYFSMTYDKKILYRGIPSQPSKVVGAFIF